jgi:uncharacterized membrane protein YkvA (DUF1232 family)
MIRTLRAWARSLKRDTVAVYLVARHPGTPWAARILAIGVAAYALSPIDLIPDFIPVLGYLDDLLLIPMALLLVIRLTPPAVLAECRERAESMLERPHSRVAGACIVALWILCAVALAYLVWPLK